MEKCYIRFMACAPFVQHAVSILNCIVLRIQLPRVKCGWLLVDIYVDKSKLTINNIYTTFLDMKEF